MMNVSSQNDCHHIFFFVDIYNNQVADGDYLIKIKIKTDFCHLIHKLMRLLLNYTTRTLK